MIRAHKEKFRSEKSYSFTIIFYGISKVRKPGCIAHKTDLFSIPGKSLLSSKSFIFQFFILSLLFSFFVCIFKFRIRTYVNYSTESVNYYFCTADKSFFDIFDAGYKWYPKCSGQNSAVRVFISVFGYNGADIIGR